jgi:chromosome segregation ATPase
LEQLLADDVYAELEALKRERDCLQEHFDGADDAYKERDAALARSEKSEAESLRLEDLLRGSSRTEYQQSQDEIRYLREQYDGAMAVMRQERGVKDDALARVSELETSLCGLKKEYGSLENAAVSWMEKCKALELDSKAEDARADDEVSAYEKENDTLRARLAAMTWLVKRAVVILDHRTPGCGVNPNDKRELIHDIDAALKAAGEVGK